MAQCIRQIKFDQTDGIERHFILSLIPSSGWLVATASISPSVEQNCHRRGPEFLDQ